MEILKDLLLVDVERLNEGKKIRFTFLNEEAGETYEVLFNKQVYNKTLEEFEDSQEQTEKVENWCNEYFGVDSNSLGSVIGEVRKDVYRYDNFCSLWESNYKTYAKFDLEDVGMMIQVPCKEVIDDNIAVRIIFEYEGEEYESKMTYAKYLDSMKKWYPNPIEKQKRYDQFFKKFGIHIDNKEELIGKNLTVEVKKAGKNHTWAEVKAFMKKKK
ncbi:MULTISPECIES: hypothetical protein [unclassified Gemella]|uniref:hypothetical protein n=1 Tax=unclassified Gemella TaxID=2624949 RepID=UPI0010746DD2|nr:MULTISPECIES: hypothetical protein [unclassified Gemella]MBF0709746.1 hypothetical protein [Gemella sp. GL1.1]MBF0747263.1 hypothetical protein [Gemella sp. 19428wG2_WT2a]NYS27090.1 hypothetical protein [Gemella sp. GL1]TFU57848.1 hypothetical protein E4T67_06285 [Gemella sp. WT2a]